MREKDIESHLVKRVKECGGIPYKFVSPQRVGVPDRICVLPGNMILFVELKAPGQKPRPEQEREHKRLRDLGCKVLVLDTKEQVDRYFGADRFYANH